MRFTTAEDVKLYASGEKIQCLECGKWFQMICTHLRVHGIKEPDYRRKYNIPNSIALTGSNVRQKMSASNNTLISVLQERSKLFQKLTPKTSKPNPMFYQALADMGRGVAALAKTKLDIEKVKKAHLIYLEKSQKCACDFLGVKPPTLHKWFDRLGLAKKCPPIPTSARRAEPAGRQKAA